MLSVALDAFKFDLLDIFRNFKAFHTISIYIRATKLQKSTKICLTW